MIKRLVLSLLVVALWFVGAEAQTIKILGTSAPGSACNGANRLLWGRIEVQVLTTGDFPTSGKTIALNGAGTAIDATQARLGTNAVKIPGSISRHASIPVVANDIVNYVAGKVEFWFRYASGAWNENGNRIFTIFGDADNMIRIQTLPTTSCAGSAGCIQLTYRGDADFSGGNATITSTSSVLTADTWHRIGIVYDQSQGTNLDVLTLYVDNVQVTTTTTAGDPTNLYAWTGLTSAAAINFGDYLGTGIHFSGETYYDQIITSSDTNKDLYSCREETADIP